MKDQRQRLIINGLSRGSVVSILNQSPIEHLVKYRLIICTNVLAFAYNGEDARTIHLNN